MYQPASHVKLPIASRSTLFFHQHSWPTNKQAEEACSSSRFPWLFPFVSFKNNAGRRRWPIVAVVVIEAEQQQAYYVGALIIAAYYGPPAASRDPSFRPSVICAAAAAGRILWITFHNVLQK
jgi:hypothetical protein